MATELVDQFGRPIAVASDWAFANLDSRLKLPRPDIAKDMAEVLSKHRHKMLISDSRYIRRAFPLVAGAVVQKADYVSGAGWLPMYDGEDDTWADLVEDFSERALDTVNSRGGAYTWQKSWHIACQMLDADGECFVLLGENEEGWPQLQFLESHRIGQRDNAREVTDGAYRGLRIINGVIYNQKGRAVAYRVLGYSVDQDRDVSARDMIHVTDPNWFSEGRGTPTLAYSILDWYDVKETRQYERTKAKVNAAITLVESNEEGSQESGGMSARLGRKPSAAPRPDEPQVVELMEGLVRYVKAGKGDLKAHVANTPSDQSQRFDSTLVAGAFFGMGWRIEMMDLSKLASGAVRGFADNINVAIQSRHAVLAPVVRRCWIYCLSKWINSGTLPPNDDFLNWLVPSPPEFTPDPGRASQADRDNVRAGFDTHPAVIRRTYGRGPRRTLREQARYIVSKRKIAEAYGLQPDELGTLSKPGDPVLTLAPPPDE